MTQNGRLRNTLLSLDGKLSTKIQPAYSSSNQAHEKAGDKSSRSHDDDSNELRDQEGGDFGARQEEILEISVD